MTDRRKQVVTALRAAADAIEAEGKHVRVHYYVDADDDMEICEEVLDAVEQAQNELALDDSQTVEWGVFVAVERTTTHLRNIWATKAIVDDQKE